MNSVSRDPWLRTFGYTPSFTPMSPVQEIVAQLVACGLLDKEIALLLGIASSTVKVHVGRILKILCLSRRTQIVRYMFETGTFDPELTEERLARRVGVLDGRVKSPLTPWAAASHRNQHKSGCTGG